MNLIINDPQLKLECLKLAQGNVEAAQRYYDFLIFEKAPKPLADG